MMQKKMKKLLSVFMLLVLAFACQYFIVPFGGIAEAMALGAVETLGKERISITNGDFNSNTTSYYLDSSPTGWTLIDSSKPTTAGIINTNSERFSEYSGNYNLSNNPETYYKDVKDKKVLMINAKNSTSISNAYNQGFKSSNITLDAYSFYEFSVLTKTEVGAVSSIYLKGATEEKSLSFENVISTSWSQYKFFVETGSSKETMNFELYLGTDTSVYSANAVFFDNIEGYKLSRQYFNEQKTNDSKNKILTIEKNYINFNSEDENDIFFEDFENGISNWTQVNAFPAGTIHQVINTKNHNLMEDEQFTSLGGDNFSGNKALWLATKEPKERGFGYKSTEINLPAYAIYKLNINAKVDKDTTARILIVEGDKVKNFYFDIDEDYYTPSTSELSVTSNNSDNKIHNEYQTYSFYIYGHTLFDSSFHIELWLGSETEGSSGSVLFDSITAEQVSYSTFKNANDSNNIAKLELKTGSKETTILNGTFNLGAPETDIYPVEPQNFSHSLEDENKNVAGIINTNSTLYERTKENYGNLANPGNPEGFSSDLSKESNNILMLWNKAESYQNYTTESVTVKPKTSTTNSFYELTFDFKTITSESSINFNLQIFDQNSVKVFECNDITSSVWQKFNTTIMIGESTTSLTFKFSLGTSEEKCAGYLFIDNVDLNELSTMTISEFNKLVETTSRCNKVLDLTNAYMNIRLLPNTYNIYKNIAFEGTLEAGVQPADSDPIAETGIVDGTNNIFEMNNSPVNTNSIKNLMFIQTHTTATYSIKSVFTNNLEADKIYKLSVFMRTKLQTPPENYETEYGASFQIVGLEDSKISNIKTNNEWKEYAIYVNSTSAKTINLKFTLNSQNETAGLLFIDNFNITELSKEDYSTVVTSQKLENKDNILIIGSTDIKEDEEKDNKTEPKNDFNWIIIPSLITALALIIAIVGFSVRRINFKKWQKKKVTEYDRKKTLFQDIVRRQAQERRDEILKQYNKDLKELEKDILDLENENKQRLEIQRKEKGKKIDRQVEKEFKAYASKHTSLLNKKEKLIQKIADANSSEFLLSLQKKIHAENMKRAVNPEKEQANDNEEQSTTNVKED